MTTQPERYVVSLDALYTDPERVGGPVVSYQPVSKVRGLKLLLTREDGASMTICTDRDDNDGHLMQWHAGTEATMPMQSLVQEANAYADLKARCEQVTGLHTLAPNIGRNAATGEPYSYCRHCTHEWPCPTVRVFS